MASRDALPLSTSGHVVVDHSVPAPLGDPANSAIGQRSSDRHVVVDGRESLSAAAYPQPASIPFQYHRTQVLLSPSSHPSRARATPLGAGRRDDSTAAIQWTPYESRLDRPPWTHLRVRCDVHTNVRGRLRGARRRRVRRVRPEWRGGGVLVLRLVRRQQRRRHAGLRRSSLWQVCPSRR